MVSLELLPVEVVFHPNWWNKNCRVRFNRDFFFDSETRLESNRLMRQYLYERFPDLGLGEKDAKPRPMVGGTLLAAGFIISAILGCEIKYFDDASPEVITANLTDNEIEKLETPNILDTQVMGDLSRLLSTLQQKFDYVEGDINWEGVQNVALNLRGQQLFVDYCVNPGLANRLLDTVANVITQFLDFMILKTGTTSISVNRIVAHVNPKINLHSNCTVTMISADQYREYLLKYDQTFSEKFRPYGIHYCGDDMHRMIPGFTQVDGATFFDVGWGSDVHLCRQAFPDKFLSLRLSPARMLSESKEEIENDIVNLMRNAGPLQKTALCCVNLDYGTPDENIRTIFEVAERYRKRYAES
ncbi:MAG: uroporphyrinogen decarboxylase family protein [Candidatus Neomarinimicrobiota bacterium]